MLLEKGVGERNIMAFLDWRFGITDLEMVKTETRDIDRVPFVFEPMQVVWESDKGAGGSDGTMTLDKTRLFGFSCQFYLYVNLSVWLKITPKNSRTKVIFSNSHIICKPESQ
jgi:hypothetical protein